MNNRPPKVRRRDYTADVHQNFNQYVDFEQLDSNAITHVKFSNNEPDIVLDRKINYDFISGRCNFDAYATNLIMSTDYWHSITVHHLGVFTKDEIMRAIDDMVDNTPFIPINYRSGKMEDIFYVYNQSAALFNMLKKNLQIVVGNRRLSLNLKLAVAIRKAGQYEPDEKINAAIEYILNRFRENRLDFSHFEKNTNNIMIDMKLSMRNKANFELFCSHLLSNLFREKYASVVNNLHILVLVKNNIKHLKPLEKFIRCRCIQNISLKNNAIESVSEFEALKPLKLKSLSIGGNPVAAKEETADEIISLLDTLEKLDIKKVRISEAQEAIQNETIIMPSTSVTEEIIKFTDITEDFKNKFPRKDYTKTHWSKVVIEHNGRFEGRDVLDEMFRVFFEDVLCCPCYYKSGELEDSFMLQNNFEPMNTLVQNNLRMKMPGTNELVTFRIHLKVSTLKSTDVKWGDALGRAIDKRMQGIKLNLRKFEDEHELRDIIVNFSSVPIKNYIVCSAVNRNLRIFEVILSENKIRSLRGFEFMKNFGELISLDLSHNELESLDHFPPDLKIQELYLRNNPLCDTFKTSSISPYVYVKTLKGLCPQLQRIDERKIDNDYKMVHLHNFFITTVAYPAVENFIPFFFKNFDVMESRKGLLINALYRNNSMLSVIESGSKALYSGAKNIMDYYSSFPYTEHDFITMTIDTPLFNSQNILFVVNGVFRQKAFTMNAEDKLLTFSRTFLLRVDRRGLRGRTLGTLSNTFTFEIANEIFVFDILKDSRIKNKVFKKQTVREHDIERVYEERYSEENEFIANKEILRQTTLLNDKWCTRLMEDAKGNFVIALGTFLQFYKCRMFKKEDFVLPRL